MRILIKFRSATYSRPLLLITFGSLICSALAQHPDKSSEPANQRVLQTRVQQTSLSQVTILEAAARILVAAHVPGGIIASYGCAQEASFNFEMPNTTLEEALNLITNADHTYRWELNFSTVNVVPRGGIPDFLHTQIKEIDTGNTPQSIGALSSTLFSKEEVKAKLAHSNLVPAIRTIVRGIQTQPKQLHVALHNSSLLEALDTFAAAHGEAVWEYEEFDCRKPREYQLEWRRD